MRAYAEIDHDYVFQPSSTSGRLMHDRELREHLLAGGLRVERTAVDLETCVRLARRRHRTGVVRSSMPVTASVRAGHPARGFEDRDAWGA